MPEIEQDPPSEAEQLARWLQNEHDRRFGSECDRREIENVEDGDETVWVCRGCNYVIVRVGGDGDA